MRRLQAEAAERRMRENETRGIKDIESVKRQQAKKEQYEKMTDQSNMNRNESGLKVRAI